MTTLDDKRPTDEEARSVGWAILARLARDQSRAYRDMEEQATAVGHEAISAFLKLRSGA